MKKIRFIKDFATWKVGDERSASKRSAEDFVNNGYAEYVEKNKFSLFQNGISNVTPNKEITLEDFFELIKEDTPLFSKIRECTDKKERDKLKSKLSYVTFAGIFSKRNAESLIKSSGYACIDIDNVSDLEQIKGKLKQDKYTHSFFISPSGKGLKLIVRIPEVKNNEEYKQYWISIAQHYGSKDTDEGTKDISRACYLSFDSEPYFNKDSEVYTSKSVQDNSEKVILKEEGTEIETSLSEIIEKDKKIRELFNAESEAINKFKSRSEAEESLVFHLVKSGLDKEQVFSVMSSCKIGKWNEANINYRNLTYKNAVKLVTEEKGYQESKGFSEIPEEEKEILLNSNLFNNLIKELDKKIEGEEKSKKALTLSLCSAWVKDSDIPLNSLVSSESSAGKSFICKKIVGLFPSEMVEYRTKITPEVFTYWKMNEENWDWNGKICYLEDISQAVLDSATFKIMCSEGSKTTTLIKQKPVDIEIKGKPVMLVTTATTIPSTEILNRFQIISLDESKEQTRAIAFRQARQRTSEKFNEKITNAFRFLKRRNVFIPYAEKIAQFVSEQNGFESIRMRRDFSRLLDLIRCSAVLYQYQREENDKGELIATEQDYIIAREVINYIQTQTFKGLTHTLKKAFDYCKEMGKERDFTAREIYSRFPFVTYKMWYNYLGDLLERGMIYNILKKTEEVKQRVTFYNTKSEKVFSLPEFSFLPESITNDTIDTIDTNDTIVTKVRKTENNCNNCNNILGNPTLNQEQEQEIIPIIKISKEKKEDSEKE